MTFLLIDERSMSIWTIVAREANAEIERLNLIIKKLQRSQFGRRAERLDDDQLQLGLEESVYCVAGQCYGSMQHQDGSQITYNLQHPIDFNQPYYFAGGYLDSGANIYKLTSAAVNVETMLHEYAHELDGNIMAFGPYVGQPHAGAIDTSGFYNILLDMSTWSPNTECAQVRTTDVMDYISYYGFNPGYFGCAAGTSSASEEFAEAFQIYVTSGASFRAAAQLRPLLAQQYDWLKQNVFNGVEFDTDLQQGLASGCTDVPAPRHTQPGYVSCSEDAVWDGTLPVLQE